MFNQQTGTFCMHLLYYRSYLENMCGNIIHAFNMLYFLSHLFWLGLAEWIWVLGYCWDLPSFSMLCQSVSLFNSVLIRDIFGQSIFPYQEYLRCLNDYFSQTMPALES